MENLLKNKFVYQYKRMNKKYYRIKVNNIDLTEIFPNFNNIFGDYY